MPELSQTQIEKIIDGLASNSQAIEELTDRRRSSGQKAAIQWTASIVGILTLCWMMLTFFTTSFKSAIEKNSQQENAILMKEIELIIKDSNSPQNSDIVELKSRMGRAEADIESLMKR